MTTRLVNATLFCIATFAVAACGSDSTGNDANGSSSGGGGASGENASGGEQGTGVGRGTDNTPGSNLNPDGVAYPTEGIGITARRTNRPGDKIDNYKFQGYPDGNAANGLKPMKMADFYDPEVKRNVKLIHIQASGTWCSVCKSESTAVAPKLAEWREKGIVYIVSMAEGPTQGVGSDQKDLDKWLKDHSLSTPAWLDSGNQQLGRFYNAAAMPWNATIDATTMEILDSHMGFGGGPDPVGDMTKEYDAWIKEIDARP